MPVIQQVPLFVRVLVADIDAFWTLPARERLTIMATMLASMTAAFLPDLSIANNNASLTGLNTFRTLLSHAHGKNITNLKFVYI
jgi:hypothetical protein